jgi:hypothetical protein
MYQHDSIGGCALFGLKLVVMLLLSLPVLVLPRIVVNVLVWWRYLISRWCDAVVVVGARQTWTFPSSSITVIVSALAFGAGAKGVDSVVTGDVACHFVEALG